MAGTPLWFAAYRKALLLVGTSALGLVTGVDLSVAASVTNGTAHSIQNATRISAFFVNVTAIAGGSATVTVKLQMSPDGGVTWLDTGMTSSALSATGVVTVAITIDLFPMVRCVATLSNTTTPTATYSAWMGYASEAGNLPAGE